MKHGINIILLSVILILTVFSFHVSAQDSLNKVKKGLSFGLLPVIGFNSDIGFQYGLIANLYNFGDGSRYPDYKYSLYTEFSRTTKGAGINQVFFDSKYLLPRKMRITSDLSYLTELALNFYGFNGYEAAYNPSFEQDDQLRYISRMFYRHQRKFLRFSTDFQGDTDVEHLRWFAGFGYFDFRISTIDIERLNKGKDDEDLLPDTTLLYDLYTQLGFIEEKEKNGGIISALKVGLIFDSRDREVNPNRGVWSEAILFYNTGLFNKYNNAYLKLALTHRQYISIYKNKLNLALRGGYQGTLVGEVPFYMQPYMIGSFSMATTIDGLGGAKTLRGILRNRIVGNGIVYGNTELRWTLLRTRFMKQNFYLAINAFCDAGRVVDKIEFNSSQLAVIPELNYEDLFTTDNEKIHSSAGLGLKIVMNHNFAVSLDYGRAFDQRNGIDGFYAGIGYLF